MCLQLRTVINLLSVHAKWTKNNNTQTLKCLLLHRAKAVALDRKNEDERQYKWEECV